jgi:hypothetical protein
MPVEKAETVVPGLDGIQDTGYGQIPVMFFIDEPSPLYDALVRWSPLELALENYKQDIENG